MRGVTDIAQAFNLTADISTHTPHAGRDVAAAGDKPGQMQFQLTRPMRGVTKPFLLLQRS